jgi:hypothetical protein
MAAVVLLVAAIGGVVALQRDDGGTVVAGPSGPALLRLVPDEVPAGLELTIATDLPGEGSMDSATRVYGRGDDDDPYRDGDLAVTLMPGDDAFAPAEGNVDVRGVRGELIADEDVGATLLWAEPGLGSVMVVSHTLDGAQLVAFAEGLRREGDDLVGPPPEGLSLLAELDSRVAPPSAIAGDEGSSVVYQQPDGARLLGVTTLANEPDVVAFYRWVLGDEARPTTVRGHDGWSSPRVPDAGGPGSSSGLLWEERPGVIVAVSGPGLSEDEVRRAAESLQPATEDEWEALVDRTG